MKSVIVKIFLLNCFLILSCESKEKDGFPNVNEPDSEAYSFSPPKAIVDPKNDDEYFFNYRLANFAPSTEPFIKETFGTLPKFEDVGFWEHNSYTSHVVGFTTNLPTISIIEYGETAAYGHVTIQSESYFYQHLHYIKGLESGKTYHYRFISQDYDGVTITSGDHTFTTKQLTADIIRIPEDMEGDAPYTLLQGNAKYVLTQDLTVPTLAINIKTHNVELDLDGHTIIYDNDTPEVPGPGIYDEKATFGIRAGLWNFTNFKILNGIIKQGRNGGAGVIGEGFNPLFLNHMGNTYNEVAGITVDYYGDNIGGMVAGDGHIHHNVLYDRGSAIDDRHMAIRALRVGQKPENDVSFNSLRRFRHCGIRSSGNVSNNELYSDSFDTNSFALSPADDSESQLYNNKIFGMGYLPIGIGWGNNMHVKDNFIYMRGFAPTSRSEEYARKSAIAGMRVTTANGENMLFEDNTIVLKPEDGCTQARGIWTFNAANNKNIMYRRNKVKVEAMPGNLKNPEQAPSITSGAISPYYNNEVNYAIAAVTFSERAGNPQEGAPDTGPIIFEDNHFIGNVNLVVIGEGYGICSNVRMYGTKLEKIDHDSEYFRPVRIGFWYWDTWGNRMVDTEYTGISEQERKPFFFGGSGKMEIRYGESKTLTLKNQNGTPIGNKFITLGTTPDDGSAQTLQTDGNGRLTFDLLTVRYYKYGNSQENGGVAGTATQTDYQQYVFTLAGYKPLTVPLAQLKSANTITMEGS
jgi:hypothetical protein